MTGNGAKRKRGRPSGKNRTPLSVDERRARNAQYEKERRMENSEAMAELAAIMGVDAKIPDSEILEAVINFIQKDRESVGSLKAVNNNLEWQIKQFEQQHPKQRQQRFFEAQQQPLSFSTNVMFEPPPPVPDIELRSESMNYAGALILSGVDDKEMYEAQGSGWSEVPVKTEEDSWPEKPVNRHEGARSETPVNRQEVAWSESHVNRQEVERSEIRINGQESTWSEIPDNRQKSTWSGIPVNRHESAWSEIPGNRQESAWSEIPGNRQENAWSVIPGNSKEGTWTEVPVSIGGGAGPVAPVNIGGCSLPEPLLNSEESSSSWPEVPVKAEGQAPTSEEVLDYDFLLDYFPGINN